MKAVSTASHRLAQALLETDGLYKNVLSLAAAPAVQVGPRSSRVIKKHFADRLRETGWALDVKVEPGLGVALNAMKNDVALHIQTGNMARAFYDLMKMQSLHIQYRARCGVLILPSVAAAQLLGDNIANFDRVRQELERVFFHVVTIPVLLVGIE
jgi:hypothetical protein